MTLRVSRLSNERTQILPDCPFIKEIMCSCSDMLASALPTAQTVGMAQQA